MSIESLKVIAIIPAAGSGQRCGHTADDNCEQLPKQFCIVCDKPLIYHTIQSFLKIKWIEKIIIISSSQYRPLMHEIISNFCHQNRIYCVNGGDSRHRSIYEGVKAICQIGLLPDIVVIHDGARPLLDQNLLSKLIINAHNYGASGPICKLTSTVLCVNEDQFLDHSLDRDKYYASEMPQAFRYKLIEDAYNKCSQYDLDFNTECLDLVQRYASSKVKLVDANSSDMWKVTYKKDLYSADGILRDQKNILLEFNELSKSLTNDLFVKDLKDHLKRTFINMKEYCDSLSLNLYERPLTYICLKNCHSLNDILTLDIAKCDSMVLMIAVDSQTLNCYHQKFISWIKNKQQEIKQFFLIYCCTANLELMREQVIKTIIYLAKHTPTELSGQLFYY